jgi:AcrR family transcriptional regulator
MPQLQNAPQQRPAGRSARIGEAVARATVELITEGGLGSLTFENVATRADVNRTTLYRRWGNKSRLLTWVMLEFMADQAPAPDSGSLEKDLFEMMMSLSSAIASPVGAAFMQVVLLESRHDAAVAAAVHSYWQQRLALAEPIYTRAVARGELDGTIDYEFFTDLVFGPMFYHNARTGRPIQAKYAKRIIETILRHARASCE